eukprot:XP_011662666.1 PREDICTED: uncharacterized protein LOC105437587 [Strongylocentrotus purpuratus]
MSSSNQELPSCQREWKASSASSIAGTGDDAVTVILYNILAAIHIKPRGYPFCPTGFRETLERHPQLMVELRHHDDADIVCLQEESCLVDILPKWFCHSFKHFKSSYAEIQGEEPPFTCFTDNYGPQWIDAYTKHNRLDGFLEESEESSDPPTPRHFPLKVMDSSLNGSIAPPCHIQTLDYIWYTAEKLHCLGVEEVVKKEAIAPFWACPNQVFPSDHLLMKAKFAFRGL